MCRQLTITLSPIQLLVKQGGWSVGHIFASVHPWSGGGGGGTHGWNDSNCASSSLAGAVESSTFAVPSLLGGRRPASSAVGSMHGARRSVP